MSQGPKRWVVGFKSLRVIGYRKRKQLGLYETLRYENENENDNSWGCTKTITSYARSNREV